MRAKVIVVAGLFLLFSAASLAARGGPPQAQGARGRGSVTSFPAQQRVPGDQELITRGNSLYGIHCRGCHGGDLRGGEQGGPNLLRSQLVLNDKAGELILPVIRDGRQNPGMLPMPPLALTSDDVRAIAEYLHSVLATARPQGAPPAGPPVTLNILVGDPNAGRLYFESKCSTCHSATGDLNGIGERISNPMQLQNLWVAGGARGAGQTRVTAAVTLPNGQKFEGLLARIDDFIVALTLSDGTSRSFRRNGDVPKVEIRDPREAHRQLWLVYTDKDIHNVTAYLASLK